MKKFSVIVLVIVGLVFAGYAEAAKPKKRTRNANRIGPYAGFVIGQTNYTSDHGQDEADIESGFEEVENQNLRVSTEDTDIGYQAVFGYRFSRYLAAEFGLAQLGDLVTTGRADIQLDPEDPFVPASLKLGYSVGGPVLSAIGILPFNDKCEGFVRAGVLFASSEREIVTRVNGETTGFGNSKGDSAEMLLGLGFSWHFNQMYTMRAEVQKIDGVGESQRTPQQDLMLTTIGLIVRF